MNTNTPQGGGTFVPLVTYHHLIAVIKADIATIASIINSTISNAVGFLFLPFSCLISVAGTIHLIKAHFIMKRALIKCLPNKNLYRSETI